MGGSNKVRVNQILLTAALSAVHAWNLLISQDHVRLLNRQQVIVEL